MKKKVTKVEIRSFNPTVNLIFNIVIGLFAISCVLPFLFVIAISLTSETFLQKTAIAFGHKNFPSQRIPICLADK